MRLTPSLGSSFVRAINFIAVYKRRLLQGENMDVLIFIGGAILLLAFILLVVVPLISVLGEILLVILAITFPVVSVLVIIAGVVAFIWWIISLIGQHI